MAGYSCLMPTALLLLQSFPTIHCPMIFHISKCNANLIACWHYFRSVTLRQDGGLSNKLRIFPDHATDAHAPLLFIVPNSNLNKSSLCHERMVCCLYQAPVSRQEPYSHALLDCRKEGGSVCLHEILDDFLVADIQ